MSDEKVLTKQIAEQFLADEDSVDLSEFTAIEDDAAEFIGLAAAHPFFVQHYTTLNDIWQHNGPFFDLSGVSNLSPNTISLLRPSLSDLACAFSDQLITAVEEIRSSGRDYLTETEGIAVSGYNALFGPFFSSPVFSSDDCVFIASNTVDGCDIFGEALNVRTLYYSLKQNTLDDDDFWDDCKECLQSVIGERPMESESVHFDGDGLGYGGFYIPVERLCECLKESNWPHVGEMWPAPCSLKFGLKALTTEQASTIAKRKGPVYLGEELESLSEDCAAILADGRADTAFYWTLIPSTDNHWKLVKRWGDTDHCLELFVETVSDEFADYIFKIAKSYSSVMLAEVKEVSDATLASLVRIQGELGLGLKTLTHSQAKILSQHNAELSLHALVNISDEAATVLSKFPYELFVDLTELPESAAAILRKHPSFADED